MQTAKKYRFLRWFLALTIPAVLFLVLFDAVKYARWRDDPTINPAERAARKVLGMQIYGAVNCGEMEFTGQFGGGEPYPVSEEANREIIRWAVSKYNSRQPFCYRIKMMEHGDTVFGNGSEWVVDYKAIIGTQSGEVYEFWWDGESKRDNMIFLHRKWQTPKVQHRGKEILFFDEWMTKL